MIGRIVRPVDFERVLGTPARARSRHFTVHHLAARPAGRRRLSTSGGPPADPVVDDLPAAGPGAGHWLGSVVPKRHARRAVTRNLLKRQIRAVVLRERAGLAAGMWVVRLRAPFDRGRYPSAASDALRRDARGELEALMASAAGRGGPRR